MVRMRFYVRLEFNLLNIGAGKYFGKKNVVEKNETSCMSTAFSPQVLNYFGGNRLERTH
jgi:hypothetical protein